MHRSLSVTKNRKSLSVCYTILMDTHEVAALMSLDTAHSRMLLLFIVVIIVFIIIIKTVVTLPLNQLFSFVFSFKASTTTFFATYPV